MMALSEDVFEPNQKPKRPRKLRRNVELPAVAILGDGSVASVTVLNLSYDGCRIKSALALLPGVQFTLSVLGLGKMPANVRWYTDGVAGLSFRPEPIEPAAETPRQHKRVSLKAQILVRRSGRKNYFVQTSNVSPSGCRVEFVDRPSVGERHWVKFDGLDVLEAEVRWVERFSAGVKFIRPIYPAVFELLLARLR
ncbi:MAG: PilZ domain-containing protein [Sphingomonas bacterium]|nr:PilZ domain-containing protein [Sphingomonas bacterium]